jgi:hypothetical protein
MNRVAPRHALGWLEQQAEFRALTDRAERLLELQADLRACAPGLALTALGLENDELLVGAPSAAAAAKLRQLAPSITSALVARGWKVKRIRFRPQPGSLGPVPPRHRMKDPIPADALAGLEALAEQASDPALKEALAHLVKTHRRRR